MSLSLASLPPPAFLGELTEEPSDAQLLATLISQGETPRESLQRAHRLLESAGNLYGLSRVSGTRLERSGLSAQAAERLEAALMLGRRLAAGRPPLLPLDAKTVAAMFKPLLGPLAHEELHLVFLDRRQRYLGRQRLASGGLASVAVHVRDVLGPVLESRAPAFVLVHNHPSGEVLPSGDDFALSHQVLQAARQLGLMLVDHLVVTQDAFQSAASSSFWGRS